MTGARVGALGGLACSMPRLIRSIAHCTDFVTNLSLFHLGRIANRISHIFFLRRMRDIGIVGPGLLLRLLANTFLLMTCFLMVQLQQILAVLNLLLRLLGDRLDMEKHLLGLRIRRHRRPHRHGHVTIRIVICLTLTVIGC